jgi:predicted RNA-binding Zn-ribbon protein involved in translation (DUF1610 family)
MEKITNRLLDKFGNNAAFSCPACEKVYIVSGIAHRSKGRSCPQCGKSRGFLSVKGEDPHVVMEET